MNIVSVAVRNPAATLVASLLLLGFGVLAIYRLPIQLLPELTPPRISIYTSWRSAAPEEIEEQIIQPRERVLRNIDGVTSLNQAPALPADADLPRLLIFAGVIGGMIAFGIVGLFIGPVVLAVACTLPDNRVSGPAARAEPAPPAAVQGDG